MRFLYFYFMNEEPERIRAAAPEHSAYSRGLALSGDLGGPFADRSGGMISFDLDASEKAEEVVPTIHPYDSIWSRTGD
jgi:uncharacterized protein